MDSMNSTKMFRIYEHDLALLERCLPILMDALQPAAFEWPHTQVAMQECKRILSDIRWDYGPYSGMQIIPAGRQEADDAQA